MNEEIVDELKRFAKQLDAGAAACGKECDSRADLIRGLLAENSRLERAIETLQASHKIEVEKLENHHFNHAGAKLLSDRHSQASAEDTKPDNANIRTQSENEQHGV